MMKITLTPALLSATGWFIGLLIVMIVVTALFATVLVIALKPIKRYEPDDDMSKKLERRETELTIKLLKNSNDPKKTELLLRELREVTSAEKLVNRIMEEESASADAAEGKRAHAKGGAAPRTNAPRANAAKPAQGQAQKPQQPARAQQNAQGQPQKPAQGQVKKPQQPVQAQQNAQAQPQKQPAQAQQNVQAQPKKQPAQAQPKAQRPQQNAQPKQQSAQKKQNVQAQQPAQAKPEAQDKN